MNSSAAIHIVSPAEFDRSTAQTPGSDRRAAIAPALGIASAIWGGLFEVEPGFPDGNSSSRRTGDDRVRPFGHLRDSLGRKRRIGRSRKGWRFYPCPRFSPAYGNQSFKPGAVSMGRRAKHCNAHRRQSSRQYLAVSRMLSSCGTAFGRKPIALPQHLHELRQHGVSHGRARV